MTQVDDSTVEINPTPNQDDIFVCPEDFCSAFFKIHNGLQKHVGNGKHFIIQKDKTSSVDTIKKFGLIHLVFQNQNPTLTTLKVEL